MTTPSFNVQAVVRRAAAKAGHQVMAATTGAQALELAFSAHPDLIVLDVGFPDTDGRDVLAKLKADALTAHIPILVWSGHKASESNSRISSLIHPTTKPPIKNAPSINPNAVMTIMSCGGADPLAAL